MYRDESFEGTLKEKADEYRMYPSQQTWENIQKQIKRRNRTFNFKSFGLSTLLLLGFAITAGDDELTNSGSTSSSSLQQPFTSTDENDIAKTTEAPVVSIHTVINKKSLSETTVEVGNNDDIILEEPLPVEASAVTSEAKTEEPVAIIPQSIEE